MTDNVLGKLPDSTKMTLISERVNASDRAHLVEVLKKDPRLAAQVRNYVLVQRAKIEAAGRDETGLTAIDVADWERAGHHGVAELAKALDLDKL